MGDLMLLYNVVIVTHQRAFTKKLAIGKNRI